MKPVPNQLAAWITSPLAVFPLGWRAWKRQRDQGRSLSVVIGNLSNRIRQRGWGIILHDLRRFGPDFRSNDYSYWIRTQEKADETHFRKLRDDLGRLAFKPKISVLIQVVGPPSGNCRAAVESVLGQIYENWELYIVCTSEGAGIGSSLGKVAALDPRITFIPFEGNLSGSETCNKILELADVEWLAVLGQDDAIAPHGLAEMALEIARNPDCAIVYSDEDELGPAGRRLNPHFKPDFSRELFRSKNYLGALTIRRAATARAIGGWRPDMGGGSNYDLDLRIFERVGSAAIRHVSKVLYHRRAPEEPRCGDPTDTSDADGRRALEGHVARLRMNATVEAMPDMGGLRLRFTIEKPEPLVSLVIPTRDKVDLLRRCIESIREKTTYPNYEIIIVDNGSVEKETRDYLTKLAGEPMSRVVTYDRPFNYSAINNFAVGQAAGSIVGLVNNDVVVIAPDWLTEMVSWAIQPDVGCVGAKLLYADDTVQHGGVILGVGGVAGHAHRFFPRDHPGYFSRLGLVQNLSAVTGACLIVRKEIYDAVGGLNEQELTVAYNDVDFCLKVREAGFLNVWTPHAELYHLESVSRGLEDNRTKQRRYRSEIAYMKRRWKLIPDPFYSANLTLDREDFSVGP